MLKRIGGLAICAALAAVVSRADAATLESYGGAFCMPQYSSKITISSGAAVNSEATLLGQINCSAVQKSTTTSIADWHVHVDRGSATTATWTFIMWSMNSEGTIGSGSTITVPTGSGLKTGDGGGIGAMFARIHMQSTNMPVGARLYDYTINNNP